MIKGAALLLVVACAFTTVECQFGFLGRLFGRPGQRPGQRPFFQRPSGGCGRTRPNHNYRGINYVVSWDAGCNSLSGNEASNYCSAMGMNPISLDDPDKANHFIGLLNSRPDVKYFWTGGRVQHSIGSVQWGNGRSQAIRSIPYWSRTGGLGRPQPDNRERPENCLGVLKQVYNDGTVFHDVACSHRKPTICEPR